jgi:hypothetical protein
MREFWSCKESKYARICERRWHQTFVDQPYILNSYFSVIFFQVPFSKVSQSKFCMHSMTLSELHVIGMTSPLEQHCVPSLDNVSSLL